METSPIQRSVKGADIPLDHLASSSRLNKAEKLDAACRAFEAVLLRQILEDATKPVISSGATHDSSVNATYRDMISSQMAENIARSGQLGLARNLSQQLSERARNGASAANAHPVDPTLLPVARASGNPDFESALSPLHGLSTPKPIRHE